MTTACLVGCVTPCAVAVDALSQSEPTHAKLSEAPRHRWAGCRKRLAFPCGPIFAYVPVMHFRALIGFRDTPLQRVCLSALAVAGLVASLPSSAAAQFRLLGTNPVTAEFQTPGFNQSDCDTDRTIELFYDGTSTGRNIHFWRGTIDCDAEDARDGNPDTGTDCDLLFQVTTTGSEGNISRPIKDFVDCNNGDTEVWAIVTDQADGSGAAASSDVASITFSIDTDIPGAPTSIIETAAGENTITVTWSEPDPSPGDLSRYNVYGESVAACPGSLDAGVGGTLVAGGSAPGSSSSLFLQEEAGTEASISPSAAALSLALGESAIVAVAALDIAGNESVLSGLSCITRVETQGFCDALRAEGGNCDGCQVAAVGWPAGTQNNGWGWSIMACALLACGCVGLRARQRRHHSRGNR